MTQPFAEDYFEARARFLAAAGRAGLPVESFWHPTATAPGGAPLAADVVRYGRDDASHVLFSVCGTHGVEGYPGSAAMVDLLAGDRLTVLPGHVAVVLLHGLNPYGWSRDSQRNEDGVDVNRNFVDFTKLPEPDRELVDRFAALADLCEMSFLALGRAMEALWAIRDEVGGARFMQAIAAGQYVNPDGFKFGGTAPSWSNTVYRDVVRCHLARATHIAELDWHTGLGNYGEIFPLFFGEAGSEAYRQTCAWWGQQAVDRGMASWSPDHDGAPAPDYSGITHQALIAGVPQAQVAGGVIELGTVPVDRIAQAVFLDRWLSTGGRENGEARFWRAQMRTLMAPRDRAWERSVATHAARLYDRTLDGLTRWGVEH